MAPSAASAAASAPRAASAAASAPSVASAAASAPGRATVVVPSATGGIVTVYGRLHAAGLRVSIPRGWSFDPAHPPRVIRTVPASGRRVRRGSAVTLYLLWCRRVPKRQVPAGRLPTYAVPDFGGSAVSVPRAWARRKVDFKADLGPLKAGGAGSLLLNYQVMRQAPAPGRRIALGRRTRSASGRPARFAFTPLSVRGSQSAPCAPARGYAVIAGGPATVITSHPYAINGAPYVRYYGCLKTLGARRLLTSAIRMDGSYEQSLEHVVVAGRFVAFAFGYTNKYAECSNSVEIYDVRTGKPGRVFRTACSYPGPFVPGGLDSLSVSLHGFAAWRETTMGATGGAVARLWAYDSHGAQVLDSSAPATPPALTSIRLRGDVLTWDNGGIAHRVTLR